MPGTNSGTGEQSDDRSTIAVDRHTIESITTYEVTEEQLSMIEAGTSSNDLNFSIALLTLFVSFVVTLLITTIDNTAKLVFFWVITAVSGVLGTYFALEYRRKKASSVNIFARIRSQKSTDAIRDSAASEVPVTDPTTEQSE